MKLTTTLAILREHQPCTEGWTKLLRHLGPKFPDDKPIDFSTILESNGLDDALWGLRGVMPSQEKDRDRLARLFACDCAESVLANYEKEYPEDSRPRAALRAARSFAVGEMTSSELEAAWSAARSAARSAAESAARSAARSAAWSAARSAAESAARSAAWSAAESAAWSAARSAAWSAARTKYIHYFCTDSSQGGAK